MLTAAYSPTLFRSAPCESLMKTTYGVIEKVVNQTHGTNYEAIYNLLNTKEGMKKCRELFRTLNAQVQDGKGLEAKLIEAENAMGIKEYVVLRGGGTGLSPFKFLLQLVQKKGLIDQGAGSSHGFHTHRLQWWLVYTAWMKGDLKLEPPPGDLYKIIGQDKTTNIVAEQGETEGKSMFVWDDLFDHTRKAIERTGLSTFGCPEYLCSTWLKGRKSVAVTDENRAKIEGYQNLARAFTELEGVYGYAITTYTFVD